MKNVTLLFHLAACLTLFCLTPIANAAKTDVIVLVNGDSITGEVKSLEFGALKYSTDSMGAVSVEWEEVVSIRSHQSLQIEVAICTN